jgi:hypothetical protein
VPQVMARTAVTISAANTSGAIQALLRQLQ